MSNVIIFVGPSGSGKTTICDEVCKLYPNFRHRHLDDITGNYDLKIEKAKVKILGYENLHDDKVYLFDIGAFYQYAINYSFWEDRKDRMICIYNYLDKCYKNYVDRKYKPRLPEGDFYKKEYNYLREKIYNLACFKIVSDKKLIANVKKVKKCINAILKIKNFYKNRYKK